MATSVKRVYWDSCTWIALIQREKITGAMGEIVEDRGAMCGNFIKGAFAGRYEIATCVVSCTEVCKDPKVENPKTSRIADFFEHEFIILVNIDHELSMFARNLMLSGYSKLKPIDACHVAAAARSLSEEMHTFDEKLLDLNGRISRGDGAKLKICKPGDGGDPLPLLQLVGRS